VGRLKPKLCGRRCIASMNRKIAEIGDEKIGLIAVQLCRTCKAMRGSGFLSVKTMAAAQIQKRPRHQRASYHPKWLEGSGLAGDRLASDAVDVGTADAEVLQFTRGHAAEFCYGLTILAPVVERACYVHDDPLS
jgi:hypothetical protein